MHQFRWNDWNLDKVAMHGVSPWEAEQVVQRARHPFPKASGDGKWLVRGQTSAGRYLQAVYLVDADGTHYVIHARPLRPGEITAIRRRHR